MASTNQSPAYQKAHGRFLSASTDEERLVALEEMIKECPKHKSSENMLANLKTRRRKLLEKIQRIKKSGKSTSRGIKKEDLQAVIVGEAGSGKSLLLKSLTNATVRLKENIFEEFTTKEPAIGMAPFSGTHIQLIENPAIESDYYDKGLTNTADVIIVAVTSFDNLEKIIKSLPEKNKIICYNNFIDKLPGQIRKIKSTLSSKRHNYVHINWGETEEQDLEKLKERIFSNLGKIRVFTKEPDKEKSPRPIIMKPGSTVEDIAEKILKGFSKKVKTTKIWGPSSKFPGQQVGLKHKLKDLDIVEFRTK